MAKYDEVVPFFTFGGNAQEAVDFYVKTFPHAKILHAEYFTEGMPGEVGKAMNILFTIKGRQFCAMDIEEKYWTGFSWGYSTLVYCDTEQEFDALFEALEDKGSVMMGPEKVMDLRKVAWVTDMFGLTWQLVWE